MQYPQRDERTKSPAPVFFLIAIGMLTLLLLCSIAAAVLLASQAKEIDRSGGFGWFLYGGMYIAAAALVLFPFAVCLVISLWRREPHRTAAIVLLICSCLFLWRFGGATLRVGSALLKGGDVASEMTSRPRQPPRNGQLRANIPDALRRHFQESGIHLRPVGAGDGEIEWIIENAGAGTGCEVKTSFLRFPKGTSTEDKKAHLLMINTLSVINERSELAMFYPYAHGKDCSEWRERSAAVGEKLLEAFRSYQPQTLPVRTNKVN